MGDNGLAYLLEMGIPRTRALAALARSKGDRIDAAERVFGGEFDDIPSDDDEGGQNMAGPSSQTKSTARSLEDDEGFDSSDEVGFSDDDGAVYDEAFNDDDEEEEGKSVPERLVSDPYAGVFYSKDRVEKVIEMVPVKREVQIPSRKGVIGKKITVPVLDVSEWMSGCPEEGEQSHLFQLYHLLETPIPCPNRCGHTFARSPDDFLLLFSDFAAYCRHMKAMVRRQCPQCSEIVCMVCSERVQLLSDRPRPKPPTDGKHAEPRVKGTEFDELLHCIPMQGIIFGVGLHKIEKTFTAPRPVSPDTVRRAPSAIHSVILPADVGTERSPNKSFEELVHQKHKLLSSLRSSSSPKGVGYAGAFREDHSGQLAAGAASWIADEQLIELFDKVGPYLPNSGRVSGVRNSDVMIHPTTLAHLRRRSTFAFDLLRNDSLVDMLNRERLYSRIFQWLRIISSHGSLASILAMPQMRAVSNDPDPDDPGHTLVTYEGAASLRELLESCVIQAAAALKSLRVLNADGDDERFTIDENQKVSVEEAETKHGEREALRPEDESTLMISFGERILKCAADIDRSLAEVKGKSFVDRMKATLPQLPGSAAEQSAVPMLSDEDEATVKEYEDWATKARFGYCNLILPLDNTDSAVTSYRHAFDAELRYSALTGARERSLAIAKELGVLTRNLPVTWHSSIFLRVDESRVDCLKAMIIGPEGTPYENGCFIFDIFLPLGYNQVAPLVKSMTTNGGLYRYNPNLYADGKVCLSLLGTWAGPGWISGQSTLLQVLISIQSLILCEEPYLNEPAWADKKGSASSQRYSANVRRMVLADAIANNMRSPPVPFENEIRTHFRYKAQHIRKQLDRWKTLDDGRPISKSETEGVEGKVSSTLTNLTKRETPFDRLAENVRALLIKLEGQAGSVGE